MDGEPILGTYLVFSARFSSMAAFMAATVFLVPKYKKQIAVVLGILVNIHNTLSPYTQGNLILKILRSSSLGSIPVHTGEPDDDDPADLQPTVYPRTHGGT